MHARGNIEISLQELTDRLGGTLCGDGAVLVRGAASLDAAASDEISFLANIKYVSRVETSSAAAVIVSQDYDGPGERLIRCADPYFAYREAMVILYGFREAPFAGVSEHATIDPSAELGQGCAVAAGVTICRGARLGAGTVLYPGVCIGPDCLVGSDCVLYPNVVLYERTRLGDRVTIHANTTIGQDGFGYATHKFEDGVIRHAKIPPVGWVQLQDDVEIGANCAIERATMGPTVIGAGTKFADLIAIGHGTRLGKHCLMVSQAGIAGSTVVGNYCVFAGQAGVVGHIKIGDGARIGAQAGVTGDIPPGQEVLGSPAIPRQEAGRVAIATMKVPEMRRQIKQLTRQLEAMQDRLARMDASDGVDAS